MPGINLPGVFLKGGWNDGEDGWGNDMNVNLRRLSILVQLVAEDVLNTPPTTPSFGARYIVGHGATGQWSGHDNDIASWDGSQWVFETPYEGYMAWVKSFDNIYVFDGSQWVKSFNKVLSFHDASTLLGSVADPGTVGVAPNPSGDDRFDSNSAAVYVRSSSGTWVPVLGSRDKIYSAATIAARDSLSPSLKQNDIVVVSDASGDIRINSGSAIYQWDGSQFVLIGCDPISHVHNWHDGNIGDKMGSLPWVQSPNLNMPIMTTEGGVAKRVKVKDLMDDYVRFVSGNYGITVAPDLASRQSGDWHEVGGAGIHSALKKAARISAVTNKNVNIQLRPGTYSITSALGKNDLAKHSRVRIVGLGGPPTFPDPMSYASKTDTAPLEQAFNVIILSSSNAIEASQGSLIKVNNILLKNNGNSNSTGFRASDGGMLMLFNCGTIGFKYGLSAYSGAYVYIGSGIHLLNNGYAGILVTRGSILHTWINVNNGFAITGGTYGIREYYNTTSAYLIKRSTGLNTKLHFLYVSYYAVSSSNGSSTEISDVYIGGGGRGVIASTHGRITVGNLEAVDISAYPAFAYYNGSIHINGQLVVGDSTKPTTSRKIVARTRSAIRVPPPAVTTGDPLFDPQPNNMGSRGEIIVR